MDVSGVDDSRRKKKEFNGVSFRRSVLCAFEGFVSKSFQNKLHKKWSLKERHVM